jgi:type I restriction enzyme S subunit
LNIAADIGPGFTRTCPLGDLLDFRNDIVHPKDEPTGSAIFVGLEHIERDTGVRIGSERINLHEMTGRRARFRTGDIVYGYLRPYLNKVWIAEFDGICSVDQYVFTVRPKVDRNYVARFLRSAEFLKTAPIGSAPGQLPRIRSGEIAATPIPLPPLDEQRRIGAILDKADALRRKRKRALDLLNSLTQPIFLEMFGDERNSPFDTRILDTITDKITDGAHFTPTYVESGVPFLRVTDIQDEAINWQTVKYIPQEEHDDLVLRCRPEPGDVLLSKNGTIGIARYVDWENIFSIFVSLCLIKPAKNILSGRYLTAYLKTGAAQRQLRQHSKTGTVTNLHLTEIRKMLIPLPPIEEQRKWEEMEVTLRSRSKRQLRAFINSEALFLSLQSRAFSGQL